MKILCDKYPIGTIQTSQGQFNKTPGRYIDGTLYENLKIYARAIVRDMTFLGFIFSSTLEVGTGKSVLASQIGEAWTSLMKDIHGIELPFDIKNCVFKPEDLIKRSFEIPRYSFIWLDEWDDAHYWSKLGMTLRQFFRKCRQLNLFMVCIVPNWFQCPLSYAISRSAFAIDVRFTGEFIRGRFYFYNFERKKDLYILGKKTHNYKVTTPNFYGEFLGGYAVDEKEYREAKRLDMLEQDKPEIKERDIEIKIFKNIREVLPEIPLRRVCDVFGVSERTLNRWNNEEINKSLIENTEEGDFATQYNNNLRDEEQENSPNS